MRKYFVSFIAIVLLAVASLGISTSVSAHHSSDRNNVVTISKKGKVKAHASSLTCYQRWIISHHTDYVKWYHCHGDRIHICSYRTAYLHGLTIYGSWSLSYTSNHAHDLYGEGCWYG